MPIDFAPIATQIKEIQDRTPFLSDDNAFVAWFLRAFIVDSEPIVQAALKGGWSDAGIDALHIDDDARIVFIAQAKYHTRKLEQPENKQEMLKLARVAESLCSDDHIAFKDLLKKAEPAVRQALEKAKERLMKRGYSLQLLFITTRRVTPGSVAECEDIAAEWDNASYEVYAYRDLVRLMSDYVEGAAPPVPVMTFPIHQGQWFRAEDEGTGIKAWVFTMKGEEIGNLYKRVGDRLFARNIRGFLGNTGINAGMLTTLTKEPEYFWYFNNGVTIICESAKEIEGTLRVRNAQIINGQQTTRSLENIRSSKANVLVKVIAMPHEEDGTHKKYRRLVGSIVSATNWQNAIAQSDLRANDIEQVALERELRKIGYQYLRKRQSRSEAKRIYGKHSSRFLSKEEIAKAAAACMLDPFFVREGKDRLFEDDIYSKIFNTSNPRHFLQFYWLNRLAGKISREDSRFSYAKWLVLNNLWTRLSEEFRNKHIRDGFIRLAERSNKHIVEFRSFNVALTRLFKLSISFYRDTRISERDESTFFKHKNRHHEFDEYLKTAGPRKRSDEVDAGLNRFIQIVKAHSMAD